MFVGTLTNMAQTDMKGIGSFFTETSSPAMAVGRKTRAGGHRTMRKSFSLIWSGMAFRSLSVVPRVFFREIKCFDKER